MKDDVQVSDNHQEGQSLTAKYNCNIIKNYLKKARVTIAALGIIWIIFFIECLYTWITFTTAFGVVTIPPYILIKMGGNVALLVKLGQIHRLLTATILHAGILHIFMNSASLLVFCAELEAVVPFALYLSVYLIGGIQGMRVLFQGTCSAIYTIST
jgi:membrane associated rhomboid family serine protease